MKRFLIAIIMVLVFAVPAFATNNQGPKGDKGDPGAQGAAGAPGAQGIPGDANDPNIRAQAMFDAPYLLHIHGAWYFGVGGGKDLIRTNAAEGWLAYGKVTYIGTLFDFQKEK